MASLTIAVGKPFPGLGVLPEGVLADLRPDGLWIIAALTNPTPQEIEDARTGAFTLGFITLGPALWHLARFGDQAWCEAPWSAHLGQPKPPVPPPGRLICHLLLADAPTRTVRSIRSATATPAWTALYAQAVTAHLAAPPVHPPLYDIRIAEIQRQHSTADLVALAEACGQVCPMGRGT